LANLCVSYIMTSQNEEVKLEKKQILFEDDFEFILGRRIDA